VSPARRRLRLGAAVAAGLVLLAGCGGSGAAAPPDGKAGRHSRPPGPPLLLDKCPDGTKPTAAGAGGAAGGPERTGSAGAGGAADGPERTGSAGAGGAAGAAGGPERTGPADGGGAELPELTLSCLGGGAAVDLRARGGKPAVLNLWASWCQPCRTELPAFQRLYASAGDKVRVLGVVTRDNADPAERLAAALGLRFPSVLDGDSRLQKALGRPVVPMTVLLRSDGRIATVYSGRPLDWAALAALVRDQLGIAVT
jgi:thiol-disulfide isomerase/thioredoxin